jgi:hypothetical protein
MTGAGPIPSFMKREPDGLNHEQRLAKARGTDVPWKMPGVRKAPPPVKKKTGVNEEQRLCLRGMAWTDRFIDRLTPKEADEFIFSGHIMQPADEARLLGEGK